MVLKCYGSYFGPQREQGDFEDDEFRDFAGEYGTTTKRPRNLCWLDAEKIRKVASLVRPTCIMLNCVDRLDWFTEHGKTWSLVIDGQRINFEDRPMVNGKLTTAGTIFVETIEEYAGAPVKFLGVGPKHDDIIER
jgi:adenylosuccinate synthase